MVSIEQSKLDQLEQQLAAAKSDEEAARASLREAASATTDHDLDVRGQQVSELQRQLVAALSNESVKQAKLDELVQALAFAKASEVRALLPCCV